MFRELMPLLANQFRLLAPDYPGFGQSELPSTQKFAYTFEKLAEVITRFTEIVGLSCFGIYIFDYGAPIGLRMALARPTRISAIVSQNGNAYEDGLSAGWNSLREFWKHPTEAYRSSLRAAFTPAATRYQYTQGVPDVSLVSHDGNSLDDYYLSRPGAHEVQIALFGDYGTNVDLYPAFQDYFRKYQPPLLAVWGKNDPYFLPAGAEAFRRDIPRADVRLLDTGHFALETHAEQIANAICAFWESQVPRQT
jgi:pimeloyl-ACP methyl ester carboxylesterase